MMADKLKTYETESNVTGEKRVVNIEELERRIKEEITNLTDEELKKEYENIIVGAKSYVESLRGDKRIRGLEGNRNSIEHYAAYTAALNTYRHVKEIIQKSNPKKLKVKKDARHSVFVDATDLFSETVRKIAILEEYARKS